MVCKKIGAAFFVLFCCVFFSEQSYAFSLFKGKPAKEISVLFIGNSYTYTHDLPKMLAKIADSDEKNLLKINVDSFTIGGAGLKEIWDNPEAHNHLKSRHWDYVVLQCRSPWALIPWEITDSFNVAPLWKNEINKYSSNIVFFATWARKPGSHWYSDEQTKDLMKSADYMQGQLDFYSHKLAAVLGANILRIGDYWMEVAKKYPNLDFYSEDGSHPSVTGTYFNALVFYRAFSQNNDLSTVSYIPNGFVIKDAKLVRQIAGLNFKK
jgi:hypothetical protein